MKMPASHEFSAKILAGPRSREPVAAQSPRLQTKRLVLRLPVIDDFPVYSAFVTSPRARYMGGPHDAARAWDWFCNDVAQWTLLGLGGLTVTLSGKPVGQVAVCHGPIFPEPQLGWFLFDAAHEGQGFAAEAATAMRDWALGTRGLSSVVSYIDPANVASLHLAERLGGTLDSTATTPLGLPCLIYRFTASEPL